MNRKGFTLIELLLCLALLGFVLCIGLYFTKDTLSTSLSTLMNVSKTQIYNASRSYVLENGVSWVHEDGIEYVCLTVEQLVDKGYFEDDEVASYRNDKVKVVRNSKTRTINSIELVDICE